MFIVSLSRNTRNILMVFASLLLMYTHSIVDSVVYGAEVGTYIGSDKSINKPLNTIKNLSREQASKECEVDKKNNPGKTIECIWRIDKDYTKPGIKPNITPITPIISNPTILSPTLTVDHTGATAGDTVTFKWDAKGGSGCYTTVDGVMSVTLSGAIGYIPVEDVSPGRYEVGVVCPYGNVLKSSPIVKVIVSPRVAPTLSLKATLSNGTTKEYVASNSVVNQITTLDEKITLTWNSSGATTCLFANKEIPKNGSGAFTVVSANTYTYSCYNGPKPTKEADNGNVSNTSVIHFTILPPDTILPTISVDKVKPTVGDSIIFSWDSKGGKNCYSSVDGTKSLIQESKDGATTGKITVSDVGFGKYTIGLSCSYYNGRTFTDDTRNAANLVVDVQPRVAPRLTLLVITPNSSGATSQTYIYTGGLTVHQIRTYNENITLEWNSSGATTCTIDGAYDANTKSYTNKIEKSGSQSFKIVSGSTHTYSCTNGPFPTDGSDNGNVSNSSKISFSIIPSDTILPTITVDKAKPTVGDSIIFTWTAYDGGKDCYSSVDGAQSLIQESKDGAYNVGKITVDDVGFGKYAIGLSCTYGSKVRTATNLIVDVQNPTPPSLRITNNPNPTAGETVTFEWNANANKKCYSTLGGIKKNDLDGTSGSIPVTNVPAGEYRVGITCPYGSTPISSEITVLVKNTPVIVPPTLIIPPTLTVDHTGVTAGDTVTFTWDTKGGSSCYTTVDGVMSVTLSGAVGTIPVEDVSPGRYEIGVVCPYGSIEKSSPVVVVTVVARPIVPPELIVDKSTIKSGEDITLNWDTNSGTGCYIGINNKKSLDINTSPGSIEISDTSIGTYELKMTCNYNNEIKSSIPRIVEVEPSYKTTFGILYTTLHCPMISNNGLGIRYSYNDSLIWDEPNRPQAYYFWGKPALGHYCLNNAEGESVLRKHAELLKNAGIDYIVIDSTNHAYIDGRSDRSQEMIIEPTKKLLRVWSTIPGAPKVVIWAPIVAGGDVYTTLMAELDKYPNLKFIFKGHPLILNTVDTARFETDINAINNLTQTLPIEKRMTVRDMWGMQKERAGTTWQFMQPTGMQGPYNNEEITVTPGYQDTYMTNSATVTAKNRGQTFKNQFQAVFNNPGVDTVIISSWNEWGSIRLQNVFDRSKAAYTDTYDVEHNRDIEPEDGGAGTLYYDLMKDCISAFRGGKTTCGR